MDTAEIIEKFERDKDRPVVVAREKLAPVRDEAKQILKQHDALLKSKGHILHDAEKLFNYAAGQGIGHHDMGTAFRQIHGSGEIPGAQELIPSVCRRAIFTIEQLSRADIENGAPLRLRSEVAGAGRTLGWLRGRIEDIARFRKELETALERASGAKVR